MLPAANSGRDAEVRERTAKSFAYEWERFGVLREEWRKNFLDYMQPHQPEFFDGLAVLDVGTGSGRHSHYADTFGARVVAVDIGDSIDVARRNLPARVLTVQADAEALPLAESSFDFVMSIGVLHHLPDPEAALRSIARFARSGGRVRVYLYWLPPRRWHRNLLRAVTAVRRVTTRMPHQLLHVLCYPFAAMLFAAFVLPYRYLRRIPALRPLADGFPLKTYSDYPFTVCVNDQFDRFSAPIETRFSRDQVEALMTSAGLTEVRVLAHHGWIAEGVRPLPGR
jgi:ubiquinone/menaquinone biosynthesis C-methylase UbiE